jgi:hypothetical protein
VGAEINVVDARFSVAIVSHMQTTQFGGEIGVLDGDGPISGGVVVGTVQAPSQLIYVPSAGGGGLRLAWTFNEGVTPNSAFAGIYMNLSRENRQDPVTFVSIPNQDPKPLNFLKMPTLTGPQAIVGIRISLTVAQDTDVKLELKDDVVNAPGTSVLVVHAPAGSHSAIVPLSAFIGFPKKANLQRIRQMNVILDRRNVALKSHNADAGTFDLHQIALVTKDVRVGSDAPASDELGRAQLEQLARGAFNWMQRHGTARAGWSSTARPISICWLLRPRDIG